MDQIKVEDLQGRIETYWQKCKPVEDSKEVAISLIEMNQFFSKMCYGEVDKKNYSVLTELTAEFIKKYFGFLHDQGYTCFRDGVKFVIKDVGLDMALTVLKSVDEEAAGRNLYMESNTVVSFIAQMSDELINEILGDKKDVKSTSESK